MIQPALPATSLPVVLPADSLLPGAANGPEAPDFAALLATTAVSTAPSTVTEPGPAALAPAVAEASPAANPAPATGKILPPALPQVAATAPPADAENPEATELHATPQSAQPVIAKFGRPHLPAKVAAVRRAQEARGGQPEADAGKDAEPDSKAGREIAPQALAINPVPPAHIDQRVAPQGAVQVDKKPVDPGNSTGDDEARAANASGRLPGQPAPATRALAQAASQAAFHRAIDPTAPTEPATPAPPAAAAPREPAQLRVEIVPPVVAAREERPALPARRAADADLRPARPAEPVAASTSAAPVFADAVASPAAPAASASAPLAAQAVRPHEFAALVDRLVAAREAVQPHAATLTVTHAEFGPVELRFRHEERGIAVSLASTDPDFARAAAAAPQPVVPASASAAAQNDSGQSSAQRDSSATTANSSGGQSRSQPGERRGEQQAHSNQGHRGAERPGSGRRSGIFA